MRRTLVLLSALALFVAVPDLGAQDMGDHSAADQEALATDQGVPDGWMMRFDRSDAGQAMVDFVEMELGWHVTTGRAGAAIFWQPGMRADAPYRAETRMHLFSPASHAEAFGLLVGGEQLDAVGQEYVYFLVRQTGEYLIKQRLGSETEDVVGWTGHGAIPEMEPGAEDPVEYALAVEVAGEEVAFQVNGVTVHTIPADQLDTSGVVGLRINHMLDVHVEELELSRTGL